MTFENFFFFVIFSFNGNCFIANGIHVAKLLAAKILIAKIPRTNMQKLVPKTCE